MPRKPRIDYEGAIHHVITRGNERRVIFIDKDDKEEFLSRLSKGIEVTGCECYAWVLMPNHFHLMIRTGYKPLSNLMRRLLTGYAIYFNGKHKRRGHLYQNRYKSILCEEDNYFLELVRYIHLNPVRAKIVKTLGELDKYPWCGHSSITGKKIREFQNKKEVLNWFDSKKEQSLLKYKKFMQEGMKIGYRDELMGGGLRRSYGGVNELIKEKRMMYDDRVLGSSEYVEKVLDEYTEEKEKYLRIKNWTIEKVVNKICKKYDIKKNEIKRKGRDNKISKVKGLIAYSATEVIGINGMEVSRYFNVSRPAVSYLSRIGEEFYNDGLLF